MGRKDWRVPCIRQVTKAGLVRSNVNSMRQNGGEMMNRILWGGAVLPLVLSLAVAVAMVLSPLGIQTAKADNLYARIQGTVTDPTGAAVAGLKLTATNVGTNISYESETKTDGGFVFLNLPVGTYKVVASASGFRT